MNTDEHGSKEKARGRSPETEVRRFEKSYFHGLKNPLPRSRAPACFLNTF
jgi:hypothetical protein